MDTIVLKKYTLYAVLTIKIYKFVNIIKKKQKKKQLIILMPIVDGVNIQMIEYKLSGFQPTTCYSATS